MQGKKELKPKLMYQVTLADLVPENNIYRMIERELNLKYLYKTTERYYGAEDLGLPQSMTPFGRRT